MNTKTKTGTKKNPFAVLPRWTRKSKKKLHAKAEEPHMSRVLPTNGARRKPGKPARKAARHAASKVPGKKPLYCSTPPAKGPESQVSLPGFFVPQPARFLQPD